MDKKKLYNTCLSLLLDKISIAQQGMEQAQTSANNETKSSAGDKYETGRAMSQRERDLHARQLVELLNMQKTFANIDPAKVYQKVELGALVETSSSTFFISASLGAIIVGGEQVMAISAIAPIAQAMLDKKTGDTFDWMNEKIQIQNIS